MAITTKGDTTLQETVGSQVTVGEDGISSATVEYFCTHGSAVSAANAMTRHPDYAYLIRKNIRVTFEEGGLAKISATFEGVSPQARGGTGGSGGSTTPKYSIKSTVSSEPIQQHPRFDNFIVPEQTGASFKKVGEEAGQFLGFKELDTVTQKLFYGTKSYLAPSVVFQETIVYERAGGLSTTAKSNLSKLGKIDTPPNVENYITVPNGCNWLLIGADAEQIGLGYKITRQWKLSTPGGWNEWIYSDKTL